MRIILEDVSEEFVKSLLCHDSEPEQLAAGASTNNVRSTQPLNPDNLIPEVTKILTGGDSIGSAISRLTNQTYKALNVSLEQQLKQATYVDSDEPYYRMPDGQVISTAIVDGMKYAIDMWDHM